MSFDILEEAPLRLDFSNDPPEVRPEVTRVAFPLPQTSEGERLTWVSARDDRNLSTPRAAVEGGNVVPNRRAIQCLVFHPGHEGCRGEGFPLDVTDSSVAGFCDVEAKLQASNACAESKAGILEFTFGM